MRPVPSSLRGTDRSLTDYFDVALLDLDGVVYIGAHAVPGVPAALSEARARGMRLGFVTNNAARTPQTVAAHLTELGIPADADEVITSAQAAARYLAERLPAGAAVLVIGTVGLEQALLEQGLVPTFSADDPITAVVQGYSPDLNWRLLAEGAVAINRGLPWVATNLDPTVPSPRGPLPGNGSLVAALRHATRVEPVVTAGKPDPTMHRESLLRSRADRPIVVGDRLDTDIEGANAVGCPSLLVLSGVTTPRDLLAAPPALRPTYLAADAAGLLGVHPEPIFEAGAVRCRGWRSSALADQGRLELEEAHSSGGMDESEDRLDALRALCAAWWSTGRSSSGDTASERPPVVEGVSSGAREMLDRLGLRG